MVKIQSNLMPDGIHPAVGVGAEHRTDRSGGGFVRAQFVFENALPGISPVFVNLSPHWFQD